MFSFIVALIIVFIVGFVIFVVFIGSEKSEDGEVLEEVRNSVVFQILVPRENEKTPLAAEQMFASIHGILRDAVKSLDMISFEIASSS